MPERPTNNPFLAYDLAANGSFTNLDPFGQMTDQNWQVNSSTVDEYQYAYDYNGNRHYRANTQSTTRSDYYTYDGLDRLTHVDHGTLNGGKTAISTLASAQDWALDELGNWSGFKEDNDGNGNYNSSGDLDQSRAHSIINETGTLTANYGASWVTPLYDNASSGYYGTGAGNMTDMPIPGNETVKESAVYDAWNRMVEIEDHTGAEIAAYAYNGLNYRVQKVDYSQSPHVTTDYIYNENWQALEEQRTVTGHSLFTYIQYVWDPRYIDAPVCRFRDANSPVSGDGTLEETLYYCNDANMNVTALVDASGTADERYAYDAYGQVHMFNGSWTSIGSSAYDNQILFGGYRYDPESGLYHVRNRMYHPTLGRWGQRDRLRYMSDQNLYQFVGGGPTNGRDPTGLFGIRSYDIGGEFTLVEVNDLTKYDINAKDKTAWSASGRLGYEIRYKPDAKYAGQEIRLGQVIAGPKATPHWDIDLANWKYANGDAYSHARGLPSYAENPDTGKLDIDHGNGVRGLVPNMSYFDSPGPAFGDAPVHFKVEAVAATCGGTKILGAAYFEYTSRDGPKGIAEAYDLKGWAAQPDGVSWVIAAAKPTAFAEAGIKAW